MLIGAQETFHTFVHEIPLSPKWHGRTLGSLRFLSIDASLHILILNIILHVFLCSLWIASIRLRNISGNLDINNLKLSP